jgi:hypothetical protein
MFGSPIPTFDRARRALLLAGIAAFAIGCSGRDRPVTPTGPGGSVEPLITITEPGSETVTFSFTVPTTGLAGTVLTISVTAKDEDGNQGGPTRRLLSIQ